MSILTGIADVAVSGIWKVGAIATLAGAVASSSYLGYGWVMAAHDRDVARADLTKANTANIALTGAIHDQNIAVTGMAAATADAEARRKAAEQAAAGAISASTSRASAVSASKAPDCAGVLNEAWEGWK